MAMIEVNLAFGREIANYVIGIDDGGTERWFRRDKEVFRIDGSRLVVMVDETSWRRRLAKATTSRGETRRRKCIVCKREFDAEQHQRVCSQCKSTANWREGFTCFNT